MTDTHGRRTVHWVCHSPTPYNNHLFRTISADSRFRLIVHYTAERAGSPLGVPRYGSDTRPESTGVWWVSIGNSFTLSWANNRYSIYYAEQADGDTSA